MNSDFSEISFSGKRSFNHSIAIFDVCSILHERTLVRNIGRIFRKDFLKHFDVSLFGYRNSHACQGSSQDHRINSCWNSAHVIGEFSRRIWNCIAVRVRLFEKKIDIYNKIFKSQLSASFCFIYLPWILKKL